MQIIFQCPVCQKHSQNQLQPPSAEIHCNHCDWSRNEGTEDFGGPFCRRCRICGCQDLWRQKDFPQALGLVFVVTAATFSTIAWSMYHPLAAIGILMFFAFVDMLLYALMPDRLVCYRCGARHRRTAMDDQHPAFDLEVNERYAQMKKRQPASQ
ncbi:MAG: hypothetical protein KDA89_08675 [Planctomycetaceae bacterium]|nr:hypothetical protein [Planctomycetaceae bacterium]